MDNRGKVTSEYLLTDIARFMEEETRPFPDGDIPISDLFYEWTYWAANHNRSATSLCIFGKGLKKLGFPKKHMHEGRVYTDIAWN